MAQKSHKMSNEYDSDSNTSSASATEETYNFWMNRLMQLTKTNLDNNYDEHRRHMERNRNDSDSDSSKEVTLRSKKTFGPGDEKFDHALSVLTKLRAKHPDGLLPAVRNYRRQVHMGFERANAVIAYYAKKNTNLGLDEFKKKYMIIRKNQTNKTTMTKNENKSVSPEHIVGNDDEIDALLAKALTVKPDLVWNKDWCRYCGARGSFHFLNSPWGRNKLCLEHHLLWKQNELKCIDLMKEPRSRNSVRFWAENTEKVYLKSIIENHSSDGGGTKAYNLRRRGNKNNSSSEDESDDEDSDESSESDSSKSSLNSSFCSSSNEQKSPFGENAGSVSEESESQCFTSSNDRDSDSDGSVVDMPKVFKCRDCNKSFVSPSLFKKHCTNKHNNLSPFECPKCIPRRTYSTNGNLGVHIKAYHQKIVNYRCKVCGKGFFDKRHCENHENCHYNENDEYMPKDDRTRPKAQRPTIVEEKIRKKKKKKTKHKQPQKRLQCPDCDKSFAYNYRLTRHILSAHTPDKDKPHQCPCGYATARKFRLQQHQKICKMYQSMSTICVPVEKKEEPKNKYIEATKRSQQQIQRQMQHQIENMIEQPVKCDLCGKTFAKQRYLNIHIGKVHKDEKDELYKQQNVYKQLILSSTNMKREKAEDKPFKCDECDKSFKKEKYLAIHKDRVHKAEEEKEFECEECGKRFSKQTYLNKHMRSHSKVKPYTCPMCSYETAFKHRLKKHMITHSGEKPFECKYCKKRFRRSYDLTSHKKNVHNK